MSGLTEDVLRHALATAREHGFRRVRLRSQDERFSAVLGDSPIEESAEHESEGDETFEVDESGPRDFEITAPVVGFFREGNPVLAAGLTVEPGDVIGTIVALTIPNDIVAKSGGEVTEVLVTAGEPVEYGQVLAKVRTT